MRIDLAKNATTINCSSKQVNLYPILIEHADICCQALDVPINNKYIDRVDIHCQSVKSVIRSGIFGKAIILHVTGDESTLLLITNIPELKSYKALNLPPDYTIYLNGKVPTLDKSISLSIKDDFYFDGVLSFTLEKQVATCSTSVFSGTATAIMVKYRTLGELDSLTITELDGMALGSIDMITE